MKRADSQQVIYAAGFPALLRELKEPQAFAESGLVRGLHALLRAAGMRITYGETDVLSGKAMQFHYAFAHPECVDLSFVPPVETLFRGLEISWKEVTPSGSRTAFRVLKQWIDEGRIALARLKEPLLVYGYAEGGLEMRLIAARPDHSMQEVQLTESECDKEYWRYPFDEGNLLIQVEDAPGSASNLTTLTKWAAHRAAASWHAGNLAGCATGEEAYAKFSGDLRGHEIDFTADRGREWLGRALWSQWPARRSLYLFFTRMAPRFGGDERAAAAKAAFSYEQCLNCWRRFEGVIGPTWSLERVGFDLPLPERYLARWCNEELRRQAADCVDEAASWEAKAVAELVKLIG